MLEEIGKSALRGNAVAMAVGIVTGAAFGKIVTSFVNDVLMPPLGKLAAARESGAATLNYGVSINTVVDFLIVAFSIFMLVKAINRLKTGEPARAPDTRPYPQPVRDTGCGKALQVLHITA